MEDHNTLVFICDVQSNKRQIKRAVEQRYEIKVWFFNSFLELFVDHTLFLGCCLIILPYTHYLPYLCLSSFSSHQKGSEGEYSHSSWWGKEGLCQTHVWNLINFEILIFFISYLSFQFFISLLYFYHLISLFIVQIMML